MTTPRSVTTTSRDDSAAIRRSVIEVIQANQFSPIAGLDSIADSAVLGSEGLGISSLLLLRVFVNLEAAFGLTFDDAAVAGATFYTVGDLVTFVAEAVRSDRAARAQGG